MYSDDESLTFHEVEERKKNLVVTLSQLLEFGTLHAEMRLLEIY
jgi:hypothetical protein